MGVINYPYEGGVSWDAFMQKLTKLLDRARAQEAQVVLLPELYNLDLVAAGLSLREEGRQLIQHAKEVTPSLIQFIQTYTKQHDIEIISGGLPHQVDGEVRNAAHYITPAKVQVQEKLNLTPDEKIYGFRPGHVLQKFKANWGAFTILICFDSEFPQLSLKAGEHQPEVIFVPSLTSERGLYRVRWCAQARAVEHHAYVAMSGVGHDASAPEYFGQAFITSPHSEKFAGILADCEVNQESVLVAQVNIEALRESRRKTNYFPVRDGKA